jgi:hypothetical protein
VSNAETDRPLHDQLSRLGEQEGVVPLEQQLLLWVTRVWFSRSPQDSHENIFEAELPGFSNTRIDGAVVTEDRDVCSVTLLQHVRAFNTKTNRAIENFLDSLSADGQNARTLLKRLITSDRRLRQILEPVLVLRPTDDLVLNLAIISLEPMPNTLKGRLLKREDTVHLEILDGPYLEALAIAAREPGTLDEEIELPLETTGYLQASAGTNQIYVLPVSGVQIASWPGIEDRRLFDLNVRFALGMNKVRKSLDQALRKPADQPDFIAYHNGLTVVCNKAWIDRGRLHLQGISVVNGAQSVVALRANQSELDPNLRLLVKIVVVEPGDPIAQEIAVRSNTQNPVTSRNLQALDSIQLRLAQEVHDLNYIYVTRPDSRGANTPRVLRNDDIAQLLCSLYVEEPWLAVKRQALFDGDTYLRIFPKDLDAHRVVMAHIVRRAVEQSRATFPEPYKAAWSLASLTAVYICGQVMRADEEGRQLLLHPGSQVRDLDACVARVSPFVQGAVTALHDYHKSKSGSDDFKVAFKHQRTLRTLGHNAAKAWRRGPRDDG